MSPSFLTAGLAKIAPREVAVGARLPYLGHLDDVTLQTREGLLVQTLHLAGFPSAGLTGALIFYCLSLTPSLLPRDWLFQGLIGGINVAIGYGIIDNTNPPQGTRNLDQTTTVNLVYAFPEPKS